MPSFLTDRLMRVAAECEEYYENAQQREHQAAADAQARVSQLEVQAMQHQLASLRLEAQLHDVNAAKAQLEQQLKVVQDENERLHNAVANAEGGGGGKDQLDRINVRCPPPARTSAASGAPHPEPLAA